MSSAMSSQEQQTFLRALGIVPLQWRGRPEPAINTLDVPEPSTASAEPAAQGISSRQPALRLWFPPETGNPFSGPRAGLLKQIVRALGHEPSPDLLLPQTGDERIWRVAFGAGAPDAALTLPALEKLSDPVEKRIAWKRLRSAKKTMA